MAKSPDTDETIEALLQQRAQFEQWIAKLDAAGDKAPATVRQKVRGDYETRLRGVIERLRGHANTIAEELQRHRSSQTELDERRRGAEEELAEAEVRHAVGEYSDPEWQRIKEESEGRLGGVREELRSIGNEISRLAEVQSLIAAPTRRAESPAPPPPPKEEIIERAPPPPPPPEVAPAEPAAVQRMPKPPRPPREPEPAQPVDEMTFLKSVADEEAKPAPARHVSNPSMAAPQGSRAVEAPAAPPSGKPAPGVAKTLKCGECGTLNRPTEWYCERCGAELAGI
jgi:hypothetical protein